MSVGRSAAAKALLRWQKKGLVRLIRRNMYTTIDLASDQPTADRYEIASHISPTSYVGWHSALEFHGLGHQVFFNAYVGSESRFNGFEFDGVRFDYCRAPLPAGPDSGVVVPIGNPALRVTDLERTLVDCCDRIDRAGGAEELLHCLDPVVMLNEDKLRRYLAMYDKAFLYQKVGFMLELIKSQAHISDSLIKLCHERGALHVKRLTNAPDSVRYIGKWKLYVPDCCLNNEQTTAYDFI